MFWGLILKSNKRYTQTLEKSFHLAQASLETSTAGDSDVQVWFSNDEQTYLLCTLRKNTVIQKSLNLNFTVGDKVTFFSKGNGVVHLSGSLMPEGFDDDFDSDDENILEDEDEKTVVNPTKVKEDRKQKPDKALTTEEDDMDEDDELGGELESDDEESDENDDDEDDDDDSDDDSAEEEEIEEQPKKKLKLDGKKPVQNGLENGKPNSKETGKATKEAASQNQQNKQAKGNKLVLQGGVTALERQVGNGKEAKSGKKLQVYYEGRLKNTNKVFDSSKQGPGFKFTLGRGEVIKGWDIGVAGMKVGGKRTLTIPANLAYGAKGYPPTIPGNSTLVFDIELKNVF
jgi:FK506-binding nuclear protein